MIYKYTYIFLEIKITSFIKLQNQKKCKVILDQKYIIKKLL